MQMLFDIEPETTEAGRIRRQPKMTVAEKEFHVALWRIVKGKGSVLHNLSIIASYGQNRPFSVDAIKAIVKRVEFDYPAEDVEPDEGLSIEDARYLQRRYARETDPAVREFLRQNVSPTRSRPDWRRSSDRVGPIGKPKRVRVTP